MVRTKLMSQGPFGRLDLHKAGIVALIVIHALAMLALLGLSRSERNAQAELAEVEGLAQAVDAFARTLAGHDVRSPERLQAALAHFNRSGTFDAVRGVTSQGQIICSNSKEEVGTTHWRGDELVDAWPQHVQYAWEHRGDGFLERVTLRSPVPSAAEPRWLIECVAGAGTLKSPTAAWSWPGLVVVCGSVLGFCALGWWICSRMVTLSHIGSSLVRHHDELEQELGALRLASERGAIADAWNQLIDMCETMREASGKQAAYQELSNALQHSASTEFLEAANVIPEGILHVVRGNRVQYVNAMATRVLGMPQDEDDQSSNQELTLEDLTSNEQTGKFVEAIKAAWSSDHFESKTVRIETADEATYRVRVLPVMWRKRGADAIVIISDISQAAKSEKTRDAFVNQLTHELRTPLTNIRAYTETMSTMDDPEIQKECYNVIDKETRRLSRLVEEMLSQSQIDLGNMQMRIDDVDVLALLEEAVRDLRATAETKKIDIQAQLPSKMPKIQADRDKLSVVVNNLLGNALKYTPDGGQVVAECGLAGEQIEIRIRDTGIGISSEHHEKVFEPLFRVDRKEVHAQVGSGVGLSTTREIVREHGGEIIINSVLEQGSEFIVRLPLEAQLIADKPSFL